MKNDYLQKITINLPVTSAGFNHRLASMLETLGEVRSQVLELTGPDPNHHPLLAIDFQSARSAVSVDFLPSNGEGLPMVAENTTGVEKKSPHAYRNAEIDVVARRFAAAGMKISGLDHMGINVPWFGSGAHPRILPLREALKARCLYHRYPTGEQWDFILPGTLEEIAGRQPVDYGIVRRPKFELVSFEKSSTPLIQIDLGVSGRYENFSGLFPEALADPEYRNIWIYLANPHAVDICLVINEFSGEDWSGFFKGHRI